MKFLILSVLLASACALPTDMSKKDMEKKEEMKMEEMPMTKSMEKEEDKSMYLEDTMDVKMAKADFQKVFDMHEKGLHGMLAPTMMAAMPAMPMMASAAMPMSYAASMPMMATAMPAMPMMATASMPMMAASTMAYSSMPMSYGMMHTPASTMAINNWGWNNWNMNSAWAY